ncbi:MAG: DNA recombination protein RmuC [Ghiorsea sp.]
MQQKFDQLELTNQQLAENFDETKKQLDKQLLLRVSLEQQLNNTKENLVKSDSSIEKSHVINQDLQQKNNVLNNQHIKLKTEFEQAQENNLEKLALLEDAKTKLSQEFKLLANQIFEEKQSKMTRLSKESLDNIVKPMQKDMSEFKMRMEQVHKEDIEARSSLSQHLQHLQTLNQQMSQDALNLTHALKGDNKAQGNWGEMILEKLLESSGLREGKEFEREQSFKNDEGKHQRPDVIIRMPGDKQVIIDAKVSLTDYERFMSSNDETKKQSYLRAHVKSIQAHIQTLANKRYDHLEGIHSPDYVLMFMPIEAAYLMAIEADSSIFEAAFDKRIAVVTPSTLYATLKLVEQLWRYERQTENVAKLTKQAGNLHDKFVGFIESFEDIATHVGRAQKSYDKALGQLKDGRGNLVNQVKMLADLSGKAKKEIPKHLWDESEIGEQHELKDKS